VAIVEQSIRKKKLIETIGGIGILEGNRRESLKVSKKTSTRTQFQKKKCRSKKGKGGDADKGKV